MFTGIIDGTGTATIRRAGDAENRIRVEAAILGQLERGESVAVDGVCLTVVSSGPEWFEAVVSPETLSRTTLGRRANGGSVNLERPLRLGDRLGGHLVQGHVDGVGVVKDVRPEGTGTRVRIELPAGLQDCVVVKGSIAVDGVSLTVADRGPGWFEVVLIPETLSITRLNGYRSATRVNLEVDMLGRYVVEFLKRREMAAATPVTRGHPSAGRIGAGDQEGL